MQDLARELPGLISDRIELLSLELRRAGLALAQIAALVVAGAVLAVTAWLALWACIALALVLAGLPWAGALGAVLLINLGACVALVARVRSLLPRLRLPATRRNLTLSPAATPAATPQRHEHRAESAAHAPVPR